MDKLQNLRIVSIIAAILAGTIWGVLPRAQRSVAQVPPEALTVYVSDGFKPALQALLPGIERSLNQRISLKFDASNTLQKEIQTGKPFDVAVLASGNIDDLIKVRKVMPDTRTAVGRAGIGIGLRAGAPEPDVSSIEAMKKLLLRTKSIAFNRDGASAIHINEMVERLQIADQVRPRFILEIGAGKPQRDVAAGRAEMVITLIPEIEDFEGLELIGPLPGILQSYIYFSAAAAANCTNLVAARAFMKSISSATVAPILKRNGIEPAMK